MEQKQQPQSDETRFVVPITVEPPRRAPINLIIGGRNNPARDILLRQLFDEAAPRNANHPRKCTCITSEPHLFAQHQFSVYDNYGGTALADEMKARSERREMGIVVLHNPTRVQWMIKAVKNTLMNAPHVRLAVTVIYDEGSVQNTQFHNGVLSATSQSVEIRTQFSRVFYFPDSIPLIPTALKRLQLGYFYNVSIAALQAQAQRASAPHSGTALVWRLSYARTHPDHDALQEWYAEEPSTTLLPRVAWTQASVIAAFLRANQHNELRDAILQPDMMTQILRFGAPLYSNAPNVDAADGLIRARVSSLLHSRLANTKFLCAKAKIKD